jgi:O-methyltransferase
MNLIKNAIKKILPEAWSGRIRMAGIAYMEELGWHMLHWGAPATYRQDGLLSVHATGFDSDMRFQKAYAIGKATGSWGASEVHWRAYVACWAGWHALRLGNGDFVEAGTNRGGTALTMIHYLGDEAFLGRQFFLMDTFAGMDDDELTANEREKFQRTPQSYKECFEDVRRTFLSREFVRLVRGSIPGTLSQVQSKRVLFLHIDMNSAKPEVATIAHFWESIPIGGIVLFDDYGWVESREQKNALDEYVKEKAVKILALPTGQGLLIKS